nr:hypothetical protein [uncultured Caldimonas sp.]
MNPVTVQHHAGAWLPRALLPLALLAWALAMFAAFIVTLRAPVELAGGGIPSHLVYGSAVWLLAWGLAVLACLGAGVSLWRQGVSKSSIAALLLVVLLGAVSLMGVI